MPVAFTRPEPPAPSGASRKRWTRSEWVLLQPAGIDSERLELIGGELFDDRGKIQVAARDLGARHVFSI